MKRDYTQHQKQGFWVYFDIADEIYESLQRNSRTRFQPNPYPPLTLADLDAKWVARAKTIAKELDLPWPPYMPAAEEYALEHRKELDSD